MADTGEILVKQRESTEALVESTPSSGHCVQRHTHAHCLEIEFGLIEVIKEELMQRIWGNFL